LLEGARHVAYAGGWKKLEPLWDFVIRAKRVSQLRPMLEAVLTGFGRHTTVRNDRVRPVVGETERADQTLSHVSSHI
jgi:hypothetical protein